MTKDEMTDLVDWDPVLSPAAEAHAERLRAEIEPEILLLRRIRLLLGLSQVEVADILSVTQSNVSKLESKDDTMLSVISRMVNAKGGKVRLEVETAEGDEFRFLVAG